MFVMLYVPIISFSPVGSSKAPILLPRPPLSTRNFQLIVIYLMVDVTAIVVV